VSDDNGNDYPCLAAGVDQHRARLGYYDADGYTFLWRNDNRDTYNAYCAGFVLLVKRISAAQSASVK
jgi:hypothetical protein